MCSYCFSILKKMALKGMNTDADRAQMFQLLFNVLVASIS